MKITLLLFKLDKSIKILIIGILIISLFKIDIIRSQTINDVNSNLQLDHEDEITITMDQPILIHKERSTRTILKADFDVYKYSFETGSKIGSKIDIPSFYVPDADEDDNDELWWCFLASEFKSLLVNEFSVFNNPIFQITEYGGYVVECDYHFQNWPYYNSKDENDPDKYYIKVAATPPVIDVNNIIFCGDDDIVYLNVMQNDPFYNNDDWGVFWKYRYKDESHDFLNIIDEGRETTKDLSYFRSYPNGTLYAVYYLKSDFQVQSKPSVYVYVNCDCADLAIETHSVVPDNIHVGDKITVNVSVQNNGNEESKVSLLGGYITSQPPNGCSFDDSHQFIDVPDNSIEALKPYLENGYNTGLISIEIDPEEELGALVPGDYYIIYKADIGPDGGEVNPEPESNNCAFDMFTVLALDQPSISPDRSIICSGEYVTLTAEEAPNSPTSIDYYWYITPDPLVLDLYQKQGTSQNNYKDGYYKCAESITIIPEPLDAQNYMYVYLISKIPGDLWSNATAQVYQKISISPATSVSIAPVDPIYKGEKIEIEGLGSPNGGEFDGEGIKHPFTSFMPLEQTYFFDTEDLEEGTYEITYTYTDNSPARCTSTASTNITVLSNHEINCEDCLPAFVPQPEKDYIISAWVKEETLGPDGDYVNAGIIISFEGVPDDQGPFYAVKGSEIIDGWQRIESTFNMPTDAEDISIILNNNSNTAKVYFDDVRIHPKAAIMKSYVYDPLTGKLNAELDENNYATLYEYNEEGKLIRVKKETERGIMTIQESFSNIKK